MKRFWLLIVPVWLFLPNISGFPYSSFEAPYSDLVISHYPNALFLQRSVLFDHIIPFWSPSILGGYPFVANPLAGLWYPPGWLALLFPLPLGFNISVIIHLVWGGVGMYILLRREGLLYSSALFGALAFESMPKIFAHYGAGHLTLIYALMWTPWLLLATYPQTSQPRWRKILSPGIVLAAIFMADPRWSIYAGFLWLGYATVGWRKSRLSFRSSFSIFFSQTVLAGLLAAPLAVPLIEYTRLSTRSALTANDVLTDSLPVIRLLGLLYPDFNGHHEWMLYPGGAVIILTIVAGLTFGRRYFSPFWISTIIITLIFSLGINIPGIASLTRLPGFNLLRVPPRALFLSGMAFSAAAACGLDVLSVHRGNLPQRRIKLALIGLITFVVALSLGIGMVTGYWELKFLWGTGSIIAASLLVWLLIEKRVSSSIVIVIIFGVSLLDWGRINASVLSFRDSQVVINEGEQVAKFLAEQKDIFRIYSPSYSLPQQTAAWFGLPLVDGIDPLQLNSYAKFMEVATGIKSQGYSVTLPPFANADPQRDNAIYLPDAVLLGLLNVRYLVAEFNLPVDNLALREQFGETRIYENLKVAPHSWVHVDDLMIREASIIDWKPNKIRITATGPGLLVLSEVAYPGWQVYVDGKQDSIELFDGLLRAVQLSPGHHEIIFLFFPTSVYIGLAAFISGVILIGIS
ncbi:MAG: YfhO family protein, partial [Chloroflexi bacterium]|nr:YfhO family protein [Chloroflexota bacterium]